MLRLMSYLAPSIPAEFFELAAKAISNEAGIEVDLQFEQRISGPLPGDVNPFGTGAVDVGFVCSPTFRWLADDLSRYVFEIPLPTGVRALLKENEAGRSEGEAATSSSTGGQKR